MTIVHKFETPNLKKDGRNIGMEIKTDENTNKRIDTKKTYNFNRKMKKGRNYYYTLVYDKGNTNVRM